MAEELEVQEEPEVIEEPAAEAEPEVQTEDPIAKLASELGWAPKEEFRGNPDDWKPADEFIRAGRDIQRNVSRELKTVREQMDVMARTSASLLEQQLERQKGEWEARFNSAVEDGDPEAARAARSQIERLETTVPAARAPDPEGAAWVEKHSSWYGKDQEATAFAVNRADYYAKQGLSSARQLQAVEREMREIFPEKFPKPAKPAATVNAPGSRTATASNGKKGLHDMPAEAQAIAKDMVERGVIPNTGVYIENYFKNLERKVG